MVQAHEPAAAELWVRAADAFRGWQAGDDGALEELVGLLTPVLWHTVRAYDLEADQAEDVVQTTWLALLRHRGSVRDPQAVGGWLTTTARREAWRVSRQQRRSRPAEEGELEAGAPSMPSPETRAVLEDEDARLWSAVTTLSQRCQRLLRVVAFADRPHYGELAADLGMPVGSIGPTRRRCLDKLRQLLDEQPAGEA